MGKLDTQSTVTLILNGEQTKTSLKEVTQAVNATAASLASMKKADDPKAYQEKVELLGKLRVAQADFREEIDKAKQAHKDFWVQMVTGNKEIQRSLSEIKAEVIEMKETITGAFESIGIGLGLIELVEFGKELVSLEVKAGGIQNAFSKIGNVEGLIEKLRESSRGLIADLDLEKIATKANNANIPLDKMGLFLQFAQQRARETGQDVTELTEKLIEGLGKGTPKAMAGLGVSVQEVKADFKQTGDMVTTVANIIKRQMAASGEDVDNFGDHVLRAKTKWENFKDKLADIARSVFTNDADPAKIESAVTKELKEFGDYTKFDDKQLEEAIKAQTARFEARREQREAAQKKLEEATAAQDKDRAQGRTGVSTSAELQEAKRIDEAYQGAKNALSALNKEKEKRTTKDEIDDNGQDARDKAAAAAAAKAAAEKKARDDYEAATKALTEKIKQFNAEQLADTLSKDDKEVKSLENKYDKEITDTTAALLKLKNDKNANAKDIQTHEEEIAALRVSKADAVNALIIKQQKATTDAIKAFQDQEAGNTGTELDKQTLKINAFYDNLIKQARNGDVMGLIQIQAARWVSLNDAELAQKKKLIEEKEKLDEEYDEITGNKQASDLAKINKKYDDELRALKKAYAGKLLTTKEFKDAEAAILRNKDAATAKAKAETEKQWKETAIEGAQELSNTIFTIGQRNRQAETDSEIQGLEKQRTAALANTNLTESQKAAINADYDQKEADIKKKQFEADKMASIEQAIINGALGELKLWVDPGFPAAIPLAVGLAATTIAQVATIASQPTPTFASGGLIVPGPSHDAGGVNLVNNQTGETMAEVEGGEALAVLSKKTMANNGPLIRELLHNSQYRNGAAVRVNTALATMPASGQFANGGVINGSSPGNAAASTPGSKENIEHNKAMLQKLDDLKNAIQDQQVILNYQQFVKDTNKIVQIQSNANAGGKAA